MINVGASTTARNVGVTTIEQNVVVSTIALASIQQCST
jgi:hypothetical protein